VAKGTVDKGNNVVRKRVERKMVAAGAYSRELVEEGTYHPTESILE